MKRDQTLEVVWFKRDLRVEDHRPLAQAQAAAQCAGQGAVLPLYIAEPEFWQLPDASARQWAFVAEGLESLQAALSARGQGLCLRTGDAVAVLEALRQAFPNMRLWSHEETGNAWTFARDRRVAAWASTHGIEWREIQPAGVI
ncbi:MAG: deoxyribodipyrimidine photo-lyase, partial [Alphaproteobacteria bacterium]